MEKVNVAMVCKLMPYYRLGIFQKLSSIDKHYEFSFFGDTIKKGGIEPIPYEYASAEGKERVRWIKTKNYLYRPDKLLWQTGIIKEIFKSKFKVFVFEGAIGHYPIWLFAFLCKLRGKKVIYWTHGNRGLDKGIKKLLRIVFFRWLGDALFLYGNFQRNIMINDGYNPNKVHVIYNSLQPNKQFKILEDYESNKIAGKKHTMFKDPNAFTLIFIGRLAAAKGVLDILKVVKTLKEDLVITNCIFIGEGQEKKGMESYCKENQLDDQVYFAGALYDEESIAPYFVEADLLLSPGNVGLNCMHSLAYGVPVLTHDDFRFQNPEVEAIEDGVTGVFYKYGDFDDMVSKLKHWIAKGISKETNRINCQHVIKEIYNPTHQAACMLTGFNKVLYGE
ncbi:glycosyltransferase [Aquimarina pacifica]|uniref:glycosyltransferase n=1 Tax=Aquimarina pacifica TaxID=1296415 RepID=UPI0004700C22|nr:glycosyltransferase [Aquimarina pacifica]